MCWSYGYTNGVMGRISKTRINGGYLVDTFLCAAASHSHSVGIFRDVHLLAFSTTARIEDFRVKTLLDTKYRDATLHVGLQLHLAIACTIELSLRDHASSLVKQSTESVPAQSTSLELKLPFSDPQK